MKIIGLYPRQLQSGFPATYWLTESCLQRQGRPFFIPDWDEEFRLRPVLVMRINRVGKGMPARFAPRYLKRISIWLQAYGVNSLKELQSAGLPLDSALAFDNSLITADFVDCNLSEQLTIEAAINCNGDTTPVSCTPFTQACTLLEAIGSRNTLRSGDCLLLPMPGKEIRATQGSRIDICLTGDQPLTLTSFIIK